MITLVKHVMRAAVIVNWNDLIVNLWYPRKVMELYRDIIHLFASPCLNYYKRRRYETMSWNTFVKCCDEKVGKNTWRAIMVTSHGEMACAFGKNLYQNNTNL